MDDVPILITTVVGRHGIDDSLRNTFRRGDAEAATGGEPPPPLPPVGGLPAIR